ncbi:MAG: hypothetical protein ACLRWL_07650 [Evtepia gabavorous]
MPDKAIDLLDEAAFSPAAGPGAPAELKALGGGYSPPPGNGRRHCRPGLRKPPSTETPSPTSAGSWNWNASAGRPGRKIPWSPPRTWPRRSPSGPGFPSPA